MDPTIIEKLAAYIVANKKADDDEKQIATLISEFFTNMALEAGATSIELVQML